MLISLHSKSRSGGSGRGEQRGKLSAAMGMERAVGVTYGIVELHEEIGAGFLSRLSLSFLARRIFFQHWRKRRWRVALFRFGGNGLVISLMSWPGYFG